MGQFEIQKQIMLLLFNDNELKNLLNIPIADFGNIVAFRDKYVLCDVMSSTIIDPTLSCRLILSWNKMSETHNPNVKVRPLNIDIFVNKKHQYTSDKNAFIRRQDKIAHRIKHLLHDKKIEGFRFLTIDMGDLLSNSTDFYRGYIQFSVKHIF